MRRLGPVGTVAGSVGTAAPRGGDGRAESGPRRTVACGGRCPPGRSLATPTGGPAPARRGPRRRRARRRPSRHGRSGPGPAPTRGGAARSHVPTSGSPLPHQKRDARARSRHALRLGHRRRPRPVHVRAGGAAVRGRRRLHRRRGRPHHRGVLPPRRGPGRPLGLRRGPARAARRGEGQGQGQRPVELLPPRRRDRRGPLQPRLRLHRGRAGQEPAGLGVPQLQRPRHRQHGGAGAGRHPGAEGAAG